MYSVKTLLPQMNTKIDTCVNCIYTTHMSVALPSLCSAGSSVHNLWSANITMLSRQIPAVYKHMVIIGTSPHVRFMSSYIQATIDNEAQPSPETSVSVGAISFFQ
jgi:hypothetical protein